MLYCLKRICEPCKEHVDNNFNPVHKDDVAEFLPIREELCELMDRTRNAIITNNYNEADDILKKGDDLKNKISALRKHQMNLMQETDNRSLKASMVYLNIRRKLRNWLAYGDICYVPADSSRVTTFHRKLPQMGIMDSKA